MTDAWSEHELTWRNMKYMNLISVKRWYLRQNQSARHFGEWWKWCFLDSVGDISPRRESKKMAQFISRSRRRILICVCIDHCRQKTGFDVYGPSVDWSPRVTNDGISIEKLMIIILFGDSIYFDSEWRDFPFVFILWIIDYSIWFQICLYWG